MRLRNLLLLSTPYLLLLWGVTVVFLCQHLFQYSMFTVLFCLFMCQHPIPALPHVRELYASWAHPVIESVCKFHPPVSFDITSTSKRKVMVLLDTSLPEVIIFPFFSYLSRIYPDPPQYYFLHSSFLMTFPIVRCFMTWIGVKVFRYNQPFDLADGASCMCSADRKRDAMAVAQFAASNGMLLLPVYMAVCDGASMSDAVLRTSYPTFDVHIKKPYDFACEDPDELLREFKSEWEANHINSFKE